MLCKKHLSESTQPRWCCEKSLKNIHAEKHCSGITAVKGNISIMFVFSVLWFSLAFISKMKLFLHDFSTLSKALSWCVLILSKSMLQPSNKIPTKLTIECTTPVYLMMVSRQGPRELSALLPTRIVIHEPMLISLKGWELILQENTIISISMNGVNQFIHNTIHCYFTLRFMCHSFLDRKINILWQITMFFHDMN